MRKFKTDGSTFPRWLSWLNFGAFYYAGCVHDKWVEMGRHSGVGVLVYVCCLLLQAALIAIFIIPLCIGLFIYECSPLSIKTWLRTMTNSPLNVKESIRD